MKQKTLLLTSAIMALFLMLSCGQKVDNKLITSTSVGPISIGMEISKLPKSVEGLYSLIEEKTEEYYGDVEVYYSATLEGKPSLTIYEYEGKVWSVEIWNDACKTVNGFSLTTTADSLLTSGARALIDNQGYNGLVLDGVLFCGHPLSKSGRKKDTNAYLYGDQVFESKDFKKEGRATCIRINDYISNFYPSE